MKILLSFLLLAACTSPIKPPLDPVYTVEQAHLLKRKLFVGILWRDIPFEAEDGQRDMIRRGEIDALTKGIAESQEFNEQISSKSRLKIVSQFYRGILGRDIDPSGKAAYVDNTDLTYSQLAVAFVQSDEFKTSKLSAQPLLPVPECTCAGHDPSQVSCGQLGPDSCSNFICLPVGTKNCLVKRTGKVRLSGRALKDDQGEFFGMGATLFAAARWYKFDKPRLEKNLKTLSDNGFDYARVLGTVAWTGREIDPKWPDYKEVIAGLTDLAYDKYGIRIEWTAFGDAQLIAPTFAEKQRVIDALLEMSKGREHKILSFEIANESWQNGFGGEQGVKEIRQLAKYLKDRTEIIVAVSAPPDYTEFDALYGGDVADFATLHLDRDSRIGPDLNWRPVRQPWGEPPNGMPVSNNEPIGPGSSVACDSDPTRLTSHAVVSGVAGFQSYVYHSVAGIAHSANTSCGLGYDQSLAEMPGIDGFIAMKKYLPGGIANWSKENHHWAGHPFIVYGDGQANHMTTDGARNGVMRAYAAHSGNQFIVALTRIVGNLVMEAKSPLEFDALNVVTGEVVSHHNLKRGERVTFSGRDALILKGFYK